MAPRSKKAAQAPSPKAATPEVAAPAEAAKAADARADASATAADLANADAPAGAAAMATEATDSVAQEPVTVAVAEEPAEAATVEAASNGDAEPVAAPDMRVDLLERVHRALRDALDGLDEVARSGVFIIDSPADAPIVAAAQQAYDALRKAMDDSERAIAAAIDSVRYVGLERRSFELVKDVLLDGSHYGPSYPDRHAPLTEQQHGELFQAGALGVAWEAGEPVEAD